MLTPEQMVDVLRTVGLNPGQVSVIRSVGEKYGLLDDEVVHKCRAYGWPDHDRLLREADRIEATYSTVSPPKKKAAPLAAPGQKTCTACRKTKDHKEFYPDKNTADGRSPQCRSCNNRRAPTARRMIRNRARNRATAALVTKHRQEFERVYVTEVEVATAEAERLAASGHPDGLTARLKPGPKRSDGSDGNRADVARCQVCHTHHDADHVCPTCGDDTPKETSPVPPYVMRRWAEEAGIGPVPTRGPLPQRVIDAYYDEHPDAPREQQEETQ